MQNINVSNKNELSFIELNSQNLNEGESFTSREKIINLSSTQLVEEQEQHEEKSQLRCNTISNINKQPKNKGKGRYKKRKVRKDMNLFQNLEQITCRFEQISKYCIQKNISMPKKFILAGIVVELASSVSRDDDIDIYMSSKAIQNVQKINNGSIYINLQNTEALLNFENVIRILQSTQNVEDYNLSQQIIFMQKPVLFLKQLIEQTILQNQPTFLTQIIQARQLFLQQLQQKYINDYLKEDDFGQSVSYSIDWNVKCMVSSNFYISSPMIALLGASSDDFVSYVMRKNLFWIISAQSRRRIFEYSVRQQKTQQSDVCSFLFPNLELKMIDDIVINCTCEVNQIKVKYPQELHLSGHGCEILNNSDTISVIRIEITNEHLEKIIGMRNSQMKDIAQKQIKNWTDRDDFIINNFEYYMQSQVFLEKFYDNDQSQLYQKEKDTLYKRCKYRFIME